MLIRGILTDGIIFLLKIFLFISIVTTENYSEKNDNNSSNNNLLYTSQEINVNLITCYNLLLPENSTVSRYSRTSIIPTRWDRMK